MCEIAGHRNVVYAIAFNNPWGAFRDVPVFVKSVENSVGLKKKSVVEQVSDEVDGESVLESHATF